MKKILSSILWLSFLWASIFMLNTQTAEAAAQHSTSNRQAITITNKQTRLTVGSTLKLKTKVKSKKLKKKSMEWTSSNPSVASVSAKGKLRALSKGTTRITVSLKGTSIKTSFKLKVKNKVPLKKLKIKVSKTMTVGDQVRLHVILKPKNTTYTKLKYKVNKSNIATISKDGILYAKQPGTVKVTVRAVGTKKKKSVTIKVLPLHIQSMNFSKNNASSLEVGKTCQLKLDITPVNTTDTIVWTSNDKTKVSITGNGSTAAITALRPSEEVVITARTSDKRLSVSWSLKLTKTTGYLTKQDLDNLNLDSINKVMIVAHPDDETLWGGSHLIDDEYLVVCLTHGWNKTRSADFKKVMSKTNDKSIILSYPDVVNYHVNNGKWTYDTDYLTTCTEGISKDIATILSYKNWDEVATHNPDGEYKKFCHKKTSELVTQNYSELLKGTSKLYYFGRYYGAWEKDNIPGPQISDGNLEIKKKLVNVYYQSTEKGAVNSFGHMIPYENWILSEDW